MKIPWYIPKWAEELGRGVAVAVVSYLYITVQTDGWPTTQEGVFTLIAGALPIAYAALRAGLNKTPVTPVAPPPPTPPATP